MIERSRHALALALPLVCSCAGALPAARDPEHAQRPSARDTATGATVTSAAAAPAPTQAAPSGATPPPPRRFALPAAPEACLRNARDCDALRAKPDAFDAARAACDRGDGVACFSAALAIDPERLAHYDLLELGCAHGFGAACRWLTPYESYEMHPALLGRACERGDMTACTMLPAADGELDPRDAGLCARGVGHACATLAERLKQKRSQRDARGVERGADPRLARYYGRLACALGDRSACRWEAAAAGVMSCELAARGCEDLTLEAREPGRFRSGLGFCMSAAAQCQGAGRRFPELPRERTCTEGSPATRSADTSGGQATGPKVPEPVYAVGKQRGMPRNVWVWGMWKARLQDCYAAAMSRRANIQGQVELELVVRPNGEMAATVVADGVGDPTFAACLTWATADSCGQPIEQYYDSGPRFDAQLELRVELPPPAAP